MNSIQQQIDQIPDHYIGHVDRVTESDSVGLKAAEKEYGDSWKKRGGVGAFMMLCRKWDRLELQVKKVGYDVFKAIELDERSEGVIDDIRDLRRYLVLVEAEMRARGVKSATSTHRDNATPDKKSWDKCGCGSPECVTNAKEIMKQSLMP